MSGSETPRDLACGTCPHPKSHHYFGDGLGADMRMHTWCQVSPCPCTNYTLPRKAEADLKEALHHINALLDPTLSGLSEREQDRERGVRDAARTFLATHPDAKQGAK